MRDKRFVAKHRGGSLGAEKHVLLLRWACACARHVLGPRRPIDERLASALATARAWETGRAGVGEARQAALRALAAAREAVVPASIAAARCVAHAVAAAHMADHALDAADYALKAVRAAGRSVEKEKAWQEKQLPEAIKKLVRAARSKRPPLR